MATTIKIKDAGVQSVGGASSPVDTVNNGEWISIFNSRMNLEFTTTSTTNNTSEDVDGILVPNPNEVTAALPARINITGYLKDTMGESLQNLQLLQKSTNIKQLKGGIMVIDNMLYNFDEDGDKCIYVIVKNFTVSEVHKQDIDGVTFTLQLEQVTA